MPPTLMSESGWTGVTPADKDRAAGRNPEDRTATDRVITATRVWLAARATARREPETAR